MISFEDYPAALKQHVEDCQIRNDGWISPLPLSSLSDGWAAILCYSLNFVVTPLDRVGSGQFSIVSKAKWSGMICAAKFIEISQIDERSLNRELYFLKRINHPSIVRFIASLKEANLCVILFELWQSALTTVIDQKWKLYATEKESKEKTFTREEIKYVMGFIPSH